MKKEDVDFWKIVKENEDMVKMWPKWMQKIVITAEAANTGRFIMSEKEWKEKFGNKK